MEKFSPQYYKKRIEMEKSHPDRLLSINRKYKSAENKIKWMLKEAKKKDYTVLPADFLHKEKGAMTGLVLFKEIDGIEIAYNPFWPLSLCIEVDCENVCIKQAEEQKQVE